jgi:membrane fusion protein, adhesin transport system
VAVRDASVGNLDQSRANIEVERVQTDVERARAALDIADRDIATASLDLNKLLADTAASLSSVEASLESARESIAKIEADLLKLTVDQRNTERRVRQQEIKAPRDGRIVRLLKVGAGETVKAGDILAVVAPETTDRAVELMVYDNDIPLVSEGRQVRLQFAGWPAVQFSGFPSIAIGTFAGRVSVIDAVDDGTGRYRVIIRPDEAAIQAGEEQPWPKPSILRPGAKTTGWILLDTVPLGFELWRQFNAFPPTVRHRPGEKDEKGDVVPSDKSKPKSPFVEIKAKK